MNQNQMLNKKEFLWMAIKLSMPLMVQNLISTLVSSADTVMLGYVSQTAMSASALANQYTFVLFCLYYGMSASTSVLCAQYWGKGDKKTLERIIGLGTKISVLVSLTFFVVSFTFPGTIMRLFTDNADTIYEGCRYLKVISFSFIFMGISQVYLSALRSAGKVTFPSVTYAVSLGVNVVLNATFIFGFFGMPKLGVAGVALGTVIARCVEVLMCIGYSIKNQEIKFRMKYMVSREKVLFRDFARIGLPSVVNDVVWSLATSAFAAIMGHIGNDMVAANAVAVMVVNIGGIACRGFASSTTIVVSQALGDNKMEAAKVYSGRMLRLTIVVSLIGCAIMLMLRPFIISFYADKLSEVALSYLGTMMIMTTWRLVGEGINTCFICGCFRGGGDARFGMIIDTIFMWGVAVPIVAIAAYVLKLSPLWVYFTISIDEFEKMPVVIRHYLKFEWMKNITRDETEL